MNQSESGIAPSPPRAESVTGAARGVARNAFIGLALLACASALAGCTYRSGDVANPFTRKFTWFSFVGGEDIRATCAPGSPDRFRIVYNADWYEQVRIYELGAAGDPLALEQRVIGAPDTGVISLGDPLAPWRGGTATAQLTPAQRDAFLAAFQASGGYDTPHTTLTLEADDFYWTAASCHGGVFHLNAWLYPSDAYRRLTFVGWLAAVDTTGVPLNPPRAYGDPRPFGDEAPQPKLIQNHQINTRWAFGIVDDHVLGGGIF